MANEPRRHDRVKSEIPVELDDGTSGITRDISPSGIFFVGPARPQKGEAIRFTLEFANPSDPSAKMLLACLGEVVRVEEGDGKYGVAVAITESRIERRSRRRAKEPHLG
jgi:hypothetical protein